MKLTIKRQAFDKMLTSVYEAIPNQTPESNFKNFLLKVTDTQMEILGSDGTLSIQSIVKLDMENCPIINSAAGAIQIPAKYLLDIVKNLQSDIVTIELVDDSLVYISDELSQFQLKVVKAEEYPNIDMTSDSKENVEINFNDFLSLYNATYFATATKGPKELFCGINIAAKENKLTFVATDSFRLARKYIPLEGEHHFSITVPLKTLSIISHLVGYETINLIIDTNKVLFKVGDYTISSKLYSGEFPNVERIIPTGILYKLNVNAKEFISSIDRITIVGNTRILVSCSATQIEISSKDMNVGSSKEPLHDATFEGEDRFSIIFNAFYVTDAIKALNSERVSLQFVADSRAFLVSSEDQTITQVVTPIRSLGD